MKYIHLVHWNSTPKSPNHSNLAWWTPHVFNVGSDAAMVETAKLKTPWFVSSQFRTLQDKNVRYSYASLCHLTQREFDMFVVFFKYIMNYPSWEPAEFGTNSQTKMAKNSAETFHLESLSVTRRHAGAGRWRSWSGGDRLALLMSMVLIIRQWRLVIKNITI